jgi:L-malate glycosyltransferase
MRVVHINLERNWRGGERQTLYLMQGLKALNHESVLIARSNNEFVSRVQQAGFPVVLWKKPFFFHGRDLCGFDIIHAHETRGLQLAALWKTSHRSPLVYTRRVDNPPKHPVIDRIKYSSIDGLVAISSKISLVMTQWGVDPSRIRIIHSSIPLRQELDARKVEDLRRRFSSRKVVGCVASLDKRKDHNTLLEAAAILKHYRDDILFVLVGDGDLRDELEKKAQMLGLNVIFEGYQKDPYPYFGVFDLFVMTSKEEGLCSSILDAFRYRVPVVATAAGGIPDIVKDGETGLLAQARNPRDVACCILRMLYDVGLRRKCTDKAYTMLEQQFTVETMAREYVSLYQEITGGTC